MGTGVRPWLAAILKSGAMAEHAIPWATLVPGRSLSQIKRRFKLMKVFIPGHAHLAFEALVIKVVEKFTPELLKAKTLALAP